MSVKSIMKRPKEIIFVILKLYLRFGSPARRDEIINIIVAAKRKPEIAPVTEKPKYRKVKIKMNFIVEKVISMLACTTNFCRPLKYPMNIE